MANGRIARFMTEVAPPQLISVMRQRTSKVLDTIHEEERESDSCAKKTSSSSLHNNNNNNYNTAAAAASVSSITTNKTKHLLKEARISLSLFLHD